MKRIGFFFLALSLATAAAANPGKAPRRWLDVDRDCRNTRTEILAGQCRVTWKPNPKHPAGCVVATAVCKDVYSGFEIATDSPATALDVDHVLPSQVAWSRRTWSTTEWKAFYNDERNLLIARARTNRQKQDLMPDAWCPAIAGARRLAAARFRYVVEKYSIRLSPAERLGLAAWSRGECLTGSRILPESK